MSVVKQINQNFVIRYKRVDEKTKLIGGGQYHILVGEELANKHFESVLGAGEDKTTFKLRRGLKIVFHSK